jgi:hypothetical protein
MHGAITGSMEIVCINPRILPSGPLDCKIVKVFSPTLFWVHLLERKEAFKNLLYRLQSRMTMRKSRHLRQRIGHVALGELITTQEGSRWHRGIISAIHGDGSISVALRDWGRVIRKPVGEVYRLEECFRDLEWQAIPCALAYTGPDPVTPTWPKRTKDLTRLLAGRRTGRITVARTIKDEAAIVELELKNKHSGENKNLKDLLVTIGCARHTESILEGVTPCL